MTGFPKLLRQFSQWQISCIPVAPWPRCSFFLSWGRLCPAPPGASWLCVSCLGATVPNQLRLEFATSLSPVGVCAPEFPALCVGVCATQAPLSAVCVCAPRVSGLPSVPCGRAVAAEPSQPASCFHLSGSGFGGLEIDCAMRSSFSHVLAQYTPCLPVLLWHGPMPGCHSESASVVWPFHVCRRGLRRCFPGLSL